MNDNKKIAFNTLILYAKLVITIVISFMVSRYVLKALGAADFGLYNVVGGIVAMMNLLATSMVATSYRFVAVELGKGENGNVNKVYNTILAIHVTLAGLLVLIGETAGIYYIHNYLNVAVEKIPDAVFVLRLSVWATVFTVVSIPADGLIIAREKFVYTAILKIATSLLSLLLVIYLNYYGGNRLRVYALVLALIHLITPIGYQIYCWLKMPECVRLHFNRNKKDYEEVLSFTGWIFVGTVASVGRIQGAAMIINVFFGTILNAAFGFASQVNHATGMFTSTLRQAAIPQIMKSQSAGNQDRSISLVYAISRFSFLLMLLPAMPLLFCMQDILKLWLKNPPEWTNVFASLLLINGMISNLGGGFDASIQATGKIRKNQIGYSIINLMILPIMYVLYKFGAPPYINVVVMIGSTVVTLVFQIYIMKSLTNFDLKIYAAKTLWPALKVVVLVLIPTIAFRQVYDSSFVEMFVFSGIVFVITLLAVFFAGLSASERTAVLDMLKRKLQKK